MMRRANQIRRCSRVGLYSLLSLAVCGLGIAQTDAATPSKKPASASTTEKKHPTSKHVTSKHTSTQKTKSSHAENSHRKNGKKVSKKHGQQAIDTDRTREIQTALIREHYMQGEPSGTWDSATQAAMQHYQADQGWQAKTTPDSRALIKLGLGPSHDHLLNPESAMTSTPAASDPKDGSKQKPAETNLPQE
jgi:hypothetical protein